ncbi:hypothetical protein PG996_014762 [Apiospora saccharicola]|uniref:Uncharacterized protein n=1 Tax=Apiospora saccharicola TaxID=335842 RepID=A0ABR1TLX6_9PEZI
MADVEEEHSPISLSPVKTTCAPTPVLPELDFVLGPDDFSAILDLVDQSKLVLVAEEPGIATGADMMDDLVQDETVDLDELCSILQTSPHRGSAASMDDEDQLESSLPESPTIPPAMMIQQFAEPADCPALPGPPPSRPPPKEPMSPIKDHGHPSDSISPLRLPHTGFVRHGRDAGSPDSPRKEYGLLGKREGDVFPSQLHLPILPPQVSASPSTPKREPLMIQMPALPPHLRVAASSPESSEIEDSQHSELDPEPTGYPSPLIIKKRGKRTPTSAKKPSLGKIAEENEDEKYEEDEYDSILAQIKPRVDKGKGKEVAKLTPPHPGRLPPSPPGMSHLEASPGDSTIQSITPVEVVASSTPRSSSSSVYSTASISNPGSPSPHPSSSSITSSTAGSSSRPRRPRVPIPTNKQPLKTFEQPMRGPTPWLFTTEVDAGEEGERLRQKTLRARREAEERERVRKEKKAAEKEKKAAEKAVEKEQKLAKKTSKGSLWGLRKE